MADAADLTAGLEPIPLPPALNAAIAMPPALVEAIEKDPELLVELTRGQLAIVQDRLVRKALGDPQVTLSQLAAVHEALTKNANLKPAAGGHGGSGVQVTINFVRAKGEGVTIDGKTGAVEA